MRSVKDRMHTVKAFENRADFNFQDHLLASTYGQRSLVFPVIDGELQIGGRENIYLLVTFGPRAVSLLLQLKLFKGI